MTVFKFSNFRISLLSFTKQTNRSAIETDRAASFLLQFPTTRLSAALQKCLVDDKYLYLRNDHEINIKRPVSNTGPLDWKAKIFTLVPRKRTSPEKEKNTKHSGLISNKLTNMRIT